MEEQAWKITLRNQISGRTFFYNQRNFMSQEVVGVRIELRDIQPKIWRRIQLPTYVALTVLHDVIQTVFDWDDSHMSAFIVGKDYYVSSYGWGEFDPYEPSSDELSLKNLMNIRTRRIRYIYDFGDHWEHAITIGKPRIIDAPMDAVELLGGARRAPIEDFGGINTYYDYMDLLSDPNYEETYEYDEGNPMCWLKENEFDPEQFDETDLREKLAELFLYRPLHPDDDD